MSTPSNAADNVIANWAMFHGPAELTTGDFDGDGGLELAVLHQAYQGWNGSDETPLYPAIVTLSIVLAQPTSERGVRTLAQARSSDGAVVA